MNIQNFKRSRCAIANLLDIVGDKWSLLVIRDLSFGKTTFSELQCAPEKISSNILSQRLTQLRVNGLIQKQEYQVRPIRYRYSLTDKGRDLSGVMQAMHLWANKHIPGTYSQEQVAAYRKKI